MKSSFGELYYPGQVLMLQDYEGEATAKALVLEYDPTYDKWRPSGASKEGRPSPNHWHIAVREPHTSEWLPAAIWERGGEDGTFGTHITLEHLRAERLGSPLVYKALELEHRVADIALDVEHVSRV